ncbi:MAG TPA: GatB/YqeY domain-containing protein [Candidatus Paceibacterota bacterium]|nr:GatB/YqeY domain-containing protein [Candidatus Paceibacterota bacterium]
MTLTEQLKEDQKQALKSGDSAKRTLIGMVMTSIRNKEIDKRTKLSKTESDPVQLDAQSKLNDEEVMDVIASEVKRRKDAIAEYEKAGRPELAEGEKAESEMLMKYLPEQMSDEELRSIVQATVTESGASGPADMGKVIGAIMPKVKGKADGQRVSAMVKEILSK